MEKVYFNIKAMRVKFKYSMSEMADKLEINQSSYFQLEKGETKLTIERLYEIAGIFKVSVLDLLGEISNPIDNSEIEKLRLENENLKEVLGNFNHRVKDFEIRASMYDKIEDYYLQSLQDDYDEVYQDYNKKIYEKWLNSIVNQEDKLNSHYFIVFSENQNWYEMAINELSILRDNKLIFAWKRYNYINALHLTAGDYQDILGRNYYENMSSEESAYKVLDIRAKSEKYKYRDFEINIIKGKIKEFYEKLKK